MNAIASHDEIDLTPSFCAAEWPFFLDPHWSLAFKPPIARYLDYTDLTGTVTGPYYLITVPFQLGKEKKLLCAFVHRGYRMFPWPWTKLTHSNPLSYPCKSLFFVRPEALNPQFLNAPFENVFSLDIWRQNTAADFFTFLQDIMRL